MSINTEMHKEGVVHITSGIFLCCLIVLLSIMSVSSGSVVKNPPSNAGAAGDAGLIPGSGRYPGGENGNPFHYSCQKNPMDRVAWWATVHDFGQSRKHLSD